MPRLAFSSCFRLVSCVAVLLSSAVSAQTHSQKASETIDAEFSRWLEALRIEAAGKGIDRSIIERALGNVQFKQRVIASDRSQAEFEETYDDYIRKRVSEWRISAGRKYLQEHGAVVDKVVVKYRVPARVVAAIIGIETNYGSFELTHSVFDVLATLAYDKRRGARFRSEIFAALEMADKGYADLEQFRGSWAGALGVPQFMPSTYLQFAEDFDGDGKKDIWSHGPDLYASVANYLSHYGWDDSETWARKVTVPASEQKVLAAEKENLDAPDEVCVRYGKHLFGWKNLSKWNDLGVRKMNGGDLPKVDMAAALIVTHPGNSHGYLVYGNFCTLMRYNPSFKYALSVGALSDALRVRE